MESTQSREKATMSAERAAESTEGTANPKSSADAAAPSPPVYTARADEGEKNAPTSASRDPPPASDEHVSFIQPLFAEWSR